MSAIQQNLDGIEIAGPLSENFREILTPEALQLVAKLHRSFNARRQELLERRNRRQQQRDQGKTPDFLPETAQIRAGDWKVASIPKDIADRRVEITGPTDRKMVINALNSGAKIFMADFEDANAPTWHNMVDGHINLRDAIERTITYDGSDGRHYALNPETATLLVRPR